MAVSPDDGAERSRRREAGSLSIGALKAFVTVVDQGSFSRAAAVLGVSQPNISNQINALEQICGVRLLNRRTQNQNLTDAGRELYTRARLVISRVDDFEMTANLFSGLKRGRMSIGFSTPPATMQLISQFRRNLSGYRDFHPVGQYALPDAGCDGMSGRCGDHFAAGARSDPGPATWFSSSRST